MVPFVETQSDLYVLRERDGALVCEIPEFWIQKQQGRFGEESKNICDTQLQGETRKAQHVVSHI